MRDVMTALRSYILDQAAVAALVADRVYVPRLPESVASTAGGTFHPPKMIVLRPEGAPIQRAGGLYLVATIGVEARCYGESDFDADAVRRAVGDAMHAISRDIYDGVMLHYAEPVTGPVPEIDPDTAWPVAVQSWAVTAEWR